jgi:hypothetical protein
MPIVLVGNKCDLESEREVTAAEGAELAKSFGCEFFEVSAMIGINVEHSFSALVRELQRSKPANQESNTTITKKPNTASACMCMCMCMCVACVRGVRACVRACVRAWRACVRGVRACAGMRGLQTKRKQLGNWELKAEEAFPLLVLPTSDAPCIPPCCLPPVGADSSAQQSSHQARAIGSQAPGQCWIWQSAAEAGREDLLDPKKLGRLAGQSA